MAYFKDLIVWQKAMVLCDNVYNLTEHFPRREIYGLASQMRRCAVSIPSNIAEGSMRRSENEELHFLSIAYGSGAELETQLIVSANRAYFTRESLAATTVLLQEVMKMLNALLGRWKLKTKN